MKKFEIKNANKQAKRRRNNAVVLAGAMTLMPLGAAVLFTACPSPTQEKPTPVVPTTYSATIWGKTVTVKDERTDKTASIDTLVSKLQTVLTDISSGLDTVISGTSIPMAGLANGTKTDITTALNRGFTITISDTAVTSTEKVKIVDNKTILVNSDFLTSADFSWVNKTDLLDTSDDLETLMFAMQNSGKMALNMKAKNAVQLAAKPAMLAQKGKSLAALDMKKRNNNAMVAMKNAARVRLS